MKPLIEMLADFRLERTHNFPRQLAAGFAAAQRAAVVGNLGQNVRGVAGAGADDGHSEKGAAGSAGQFGGGDGGHERAAKQLDLDRAGRRRTINEQGDNFAGLEFF